MVRGAVVTGTVEGAMAKAEVGKVEVSICYTNRCCSI